MVHWTLQFQGVQRKYGNKMEKCCYLRNGSCSIQILLLLPFGCIGKCGEENLEKQMEIEKSIINKNIRPKVERRNWNLIEVSHISIIYYSSVSN